MRLKPRSNTEKTMNSRRQMLIGTGAAMLGFASMGLASKLMPAVEEITAPAKPGSRLPNVPLLTHEGKTVRFYDDLIADKLVVINMMYTVCTGICPGMTANLVQLQHLLGARLGRDVHMYSITLEPEHDSPKRLQEYVESRGVAPGWLFLTGTRNSIETVRYSLGFYDTDPVVDQDKSSHTGMVRIGNAAFDRWAMAPALGAPDQILSTIAHMDVASRLVKGV